MIDKLNEVAKGMKKQAKINIGNGQGLDVWIVRGNSEGKTICISAGVHGCEYIGVEAARVLYNKLEPKSMNGNVVIFPVVNQSGFYGGLKQLVWEDQKNINRVFPVDEPTSVSEYIAHYFQTKVFPSVDFLLDLHSGDINETMYPLVFYPVQANEHVMVETDIASKLMKVGVRVPSTAKNGLYSNCASSGTPAMLLEIGGQSTRESNLVDDCLTSIMNLLSHYQVIINNINLTEQRKSVKTNYIEADVQGLWYYNIEPGQIVKTGDKLGHIEQLDGLVVQEIYAEFDATILYYTTSLGINSGDALVCYGQLAV